MLYNCYLKKGEVYVPAVAKVETGGYMNIEPVAVVPASNTEALRRAFFDIAAHGNPVVPPPKRTDRVPLVVPKYAGAKTWSAFQRGASSWSIKEHDGNYEIVGYRTHRQGYWEEDPEQRTTFPPGATVTDVIDRMVAILQDAATQK